MADPGSESRLPQTLGLAGLRTRESGSGGPANLADILERVLDKGIVIAGDIQVNLLDIELLTIRIRLLIASVDRAREMGINWWESDPRLSGGAKQLEEQNQQLRARLDRLERLLQNGGGAPGDQMVETVSETTTVSEQDGDETVTETTTVSETLEQDGDESGR
ncbi:MAG: gas vesicle protein [Actinomycetota bacterium]|nr:gas vesicle protein [Actinomycetota bacterium]